MWAQRKEMIESASALAQADRGRYRRYILLPPDDGHKSKGATIFTGTDDDSIVVKHWEGNEMPNQRDGNYNMAIGWPYRPSQNG